MKIVSLSLFALLGVIPILLFKKNHAEFAFPFSVLISVLILLESFKNINANIDVFNELTSFFNYSSYGQVMLKTLGIAFITETCADICRDSGEKAISSNLELAGKVEILILSLPLIKEILSLATEIIQ